MQEEEGKESNSFLSYLSCTWPSFRTYYIHCYAMEWKTKSVQNTLSMDAIGMRRMTAAIQNFIQTSMPANHYCDVQMKGHSTN